MGRRDSQTQRAASERALSEHPSTGPAEAVRPGPRPLSIAEACAGMLAQDVEVPPPNVVFLKGIIEASEGLAVVFAERGGELTLAAPLGRGAEFAELLVDLERDVGARRRGALR